MTNNAAPDTKKQHDAAPTAASAAVPKAHAAKTKAKPAPKAQTKAAEKPARKPAADKEATQKVESAPAGKNTKQKKAKLVRNSFTMPKSEFDLINAVKERCVAKGFTVKKRDVLRAAIIGFATQSDAAVTAALEAIKIGRPPKGQK